MESIPFDVIVFLKMAQLEGSDSKILLETVHELLFKGLYRVKHFEDFEKVEDSLTSDRPTD